MTTHTPGQRPVLGARFERAWFETRDSNRSYQARNAPMSDDEFLLQAALLTKPKVSSHGFWRWLLGGQK
jgi:hypothetical protein